MMYFFEVTFFERGAINMNAIKKRLSVILVLVLIILAATPALASDYIGNANTGKFHYASCRSVKKMNPSNMVYLNSRQEAIDKGFVPCKVCRP